MLPRVIGVSTEEMMPPLSLKRLVFPVGALETWPCPCPSRQGLHRGPPGWGVLWGVLCPPLPGPPVPSLGLNPDLSPRL